MNDNDNNNQNNDRDNRSVTDRIFAFENTMDRSRAILGWIYLPIHIFALPLLLGIMAQFSAVGLTEADANLIYYVIGLIFVMSTMLPFLRDGFDTFLDRPGRCLFSMVLGLALTYLLSNIAAAVLLAFGELTADPNTASVMEMAHYDYGKIKASAIFLAPIVEEVLFRGVAFGSLRERSRAAAYIVSALLFSVYHVWQPAYVYGDPRMLLYIIQYIPVSVALARIYERSGSIWVPILFHMGFNAISFYVLY